MMVRLAHTQNYLMLSPAKEQVTPQLAHIPTLLTSSMLTLDKEHVTPLNDLHHYTCNGVVPSGFC